jgi:hypothetical protein
VENVDELKLVHQALTNLTKQREIWRKNLWVYQRFSEERKMIWWMSAQRQAEAGVTAMQQLTLEVVRLRLVK